MTPARPSPPLPLSAVDLLAVAWWACVDLAAGLVGWAGEEGE